MYLGVHVSIRDKIYSAIEQAERLGCTAMQIFSRSPRQWRQHHLSQEDILEFRRRLRHSRIKVVAVHVPYLINLATSYNVLYKKSIKAYIEDLRETQALGAHYLVTHMGSFKNSTMRTGLRQFIKALNIIFRETKEVKIKLLLENTAGSGSWLGSTLDHHRIIFDGVKDRHRLGVCLDTAHLFAAGYDIRKRKVLDKVLATVETRIGRRSLKLIHLNDSMTPLGSHNDRHERIGYGFIGRRGIQTIVNHPHLRDLAFILETPKKSQEDDKRNLDQVSRLMAHRHD